MYCVFLTSSHPEVQDTDIKMSESNARNRKVPDIETGRQQRGTILPRIASFFQFLQGSESKVQRRVDEMDRVGFSASCLYLPKANVSRSASGMTLYWIRNGHSCLINFARSAVDIV